MLTCSQVESECFWRKKHDKKDFQHSVCRSFSGFSGESDDWAESGCRAVWHVRNNQYLCWPSLRARRWQTLSDTAMTTRVCAKQTSIQRWSWGRNAAWGRVTKPHETWRCKQWVNRLTRSKEIMESRKTRRVCGVESFQGDQKKTDACGGCGRNDVDGREEERWVETERFAFNIRKTKHPFLRFLRFEENAGLKIGQTVKRKKENTINTDHTS